VGRLDLAIESLERAMEIDAGQSIVYYNLACYWSLASNAKLALAYLTRAFDLDPSFRELVDDEEDFDPIRSDPRFRELTSMIV
jgi:tetratricopeptide (TPR) repeat protein